MTPAGAGDNTDQGIDLSVYICPRTGSGLRLRDSKLEGGAGGSDYEVRRGIPQFLRFEPAESGQVKEGLRRLNEAAIRVGWRGAIEEVNGKGDRYNLDPSRSRFLDLLPLTIALAGLPTSEGRLYGEDQIEGRGMTIKMAYRQARNIAKECLSGS